MRARYVLAALLLLPLLSLAQTGLVRESAKSFGVRGVYRVTGALTPNVAPVASFTVADADGDSLDFEFTDTSTDSDGTILSWLWDFGDGNTSTSQNPTHLFSTYNGARDVKLTVTDNRGAADDTTIAVQIARPNPPMAVTLAKSTTDSMTWTLTSSQADGTPPINWTWSASGGIFTDSSNDTTDFYTTDVLYGNNFAITVTGIDDQSEVDQDTTNIFIPRPALYVDFSATTSDSLTYTLTPTVVATYPTGIDTTGAVSYFWLIEDVGTPDYTTEVAEHTWPRSDTSPDSAQVNLYVYGPYSTTGYASTFVPIAGPIGGGPANEAPSISAIDTTITDPEARSFNFAGVATDSDGTVIQWAWDFRSDGVNTSTEADSLTSHTFPYSTSDWTTQLVVTDNDGARDTLTITIPGVEAPAGTVAISSVSGTASQDSSFVIVGANFGTKGNPAPLALDDMEGPDFIDYWASSHDLSITSESRHSHSAQAAYANMQGGRDGYFWGSSGIGSETWYIGWWFKLGDNLDWDLGECCGGLDNLANIKFFRMTPISGTLPSEEMVLSMFGGNRLVFQRGGFGPTETNYLNQAYSPHLWPKGVWHHIQFEFKMSDPIGANNGIIRWWLDGQPQIFLEDVQTHLNNANPKYPLVVGIHNSHGDINTDPDDFWMDEAYVDTTWARVELGNAATYTASTVREIQIPTAWAATGDSITVTFKQNSFANSSDAWLYVTDRAGNRSAGYQITVGETYSGGPALAVDISDTSQTSGKVIELTASASGGTAPYTYSWESTGGAGSFTSTNTDTTTFTATNFDTATLFEITVTDDALDTAVDTLSFRSSLDPAGVLSVALNDSTQQTLRRINLDANVTGGTAPYTYTWSVATGQSGSWSNTATDTTTFTSGAYNAESTLRLIVEDNVSALDTLDVVWTSGANEAPSLTFAWVDTTSVSSVTVLADLVSDDVHGTVDSLRFTPWLGAGQYTRRVVFTAGVTDTFVTDYTPLETNSDVVVNPRIVAVDDQLATTLVSGYFTIPDTTTSSSYSDSLIASAGSYDLTTGDWEQSGTFTTVVDSGSYFANADLNQNEHAIRTDTSNWTSSSEQWVEMTIGNVGATPGYAVAMIGWDGSGNGWWVGFDFDANQWRVWEIVSNGFNLREFSGFGFDIGAGDVVAVTWDGTTFDFYVNWVNEASYNPGTDVGGPYTVSLGVPGFGAYTDDSPLETRVQIEKVRMGNEIDDMISP